MRKIYILSALCFMLAPSLLAQTIGVEDAQNKALQFLQGQSQTRAAQQEVQLKLAYTSKSGDETYYYVFNNSAGGYVIMGGDEAAKEVLGYGETGSFDYERIPDNMRWWLSQYDAHISQAIREVRVGANKVAHQVQTRAERAEIPVILTSTWGQGTPYNKQMPTSLSGEADFPTGCVITAVAQVMNYYRWPETGVGTNTLDTLYFGHAFTADFENTHYDWEAMADSYETAYSGTREEVAVGTLMYHLGVAFNASYDEEGTTSDLSNAAKAMVDHFRYSKQASVKYRLNYYDDEWEALVYDELSAGSPLVYRGTSSSSVAHAFVCDGYKDGLWHINWGWDGNYDDYFLITPTQTELALCPVGTGIGGDVAGSHYGGVQAAIFGLSPDRNGDSQNKKELSCLSHKLNSGIFFAGDSAVVTGKYKNTGVQEETYEILYVMYPYGDIDNYYMFDVHDTVTIGPNESVLLETTIRIPDTVKKGGTYMIAPFFKNEEGKWRLVTTSLFTIFAEFHTPYDIDITEEIDFDFYGWFTMENMGVFATIKNFSDETQTKVLTFRVSPFDDKDVPIEYFDLGEVTLAPGEERQVHAGVENLRFKDRLEIGKDYWAQLENLTDSVLLGIPLDFYVAESPLNSITLPDNTTDDSVVSSPSYSLSGNEVDEKYRGILIRKGKKIIVK